MFNFFERFDKSINTLARKETSNKTYVRDSISDFILWLVVYGIIDYRWCFASKLGDKLLVRMTDRDDLVALTKYPESNSPIK